MNEYTTSSPDETESGGEKLAAALAGRRFAFVALYGEMGVGKTAFVRGFCRYFGIDRVTSPTYTVVNEYRGKRKVIHMDLYRLRDADDLASCGFDDYLDQNGFLLCEWSEKIPEAIPDDAIRVTISRADAGNRRIIRTEGLFEEVRP